jgi:hypothetical protein
MFRISSPPLSGVGKANVEMLKKMLVQMRDEEGKGGIEKKEKKERKRMGPLPKGPKNC